MGEYSKLRREYLETHPLCMVALAESGYDPYCIPAKTQIEGVWRVKTPKGAIDLVHYPRLAEEIHHRCKRTGGNYLKTSTWMAVSRHWHEYLENHKSWAREMGYLE